MRILMVTESFHPIVGGSETAIRYLSERMTAAGHTVMVAVMNVQNASSPSQAFAFRVLSSRIGPFDCKTPGKIWNCRKIVREFRPDVVNAHFLFESGFVGTSAAHSFGIPSVVSIRGRGIFFKPGNLLEKILSRWWIRGALKADAFLATSQEMADIAQNRHGIAVTALGNGVDTVAFHPSKKKDIRSPLGIRPDQKVIFCARRLVPKNGIEYMVRALPRIRKSEDAVLLLAAKREAEYDHLKAIAEELAVSSFIHFLGPLNHQDLPFFYASADVVVQPSIAEARSLACLEAMASGAVIVATDTGGLAELLTHEKTGVLIPAFEESTYGVSAVKEGGVQSLADGVLRALTETALRERVSRGAREAAEGQSWDVIAGKTVDIFSSVLSS